MVERCRRLAASRTFQASVLALIILNALVMGAETWPQVTRRWSGELAVVHLVVQALFVLELAIRIGAHGARPWEFFRSGWNAFDFAVVALALLPAAGSFGTVARLARVLRAARLVSGLPELRLIIGTMLRSIPSMGHVVMLLGLLVYVYGVVGNHLFAGVDPEHWGTLGRAARTLFVVITLEGWVELMETGARATPWAWAYFASFIVIAVFVVINLFIAVVINNLEKVRGEQESDHPAQENLPDARATAAELRRLADRLEAVESRRSGTRTERREVA